MRSRAWLVGISVPSTREELPMNITFVEVEPRERQFFTRELVGQNLRFVSTVAEVDREAEIVCIFIYSRIDAEFLKEHPHVHAIVTRSTTTEHIDHAACAQRNVQVLSVSS